MSQTAPQAAETPSHEALLAALARLAQVSLDRWDVPEGATTRLINLSENATYLVEAPGGFRSVLRVHREGYHSKTAIASELAWMDALRAEAGLTTPEAIPARDGERIQTDRVAGLPRERHMVMFAFIEGEEPDETRDLILPFERLGEVSARLHLHAMGWRPPPWFERLTWDFDHILGETPNWGDWRAAPGMDREALALLERQQEAIRRRLIAFGQGRERYGLIHADIRLANLLVSEDDTRVIDFDDSGFGWFLYDVATALSFIEDSPNVPALVDAWARGYRRVRALGAEDEAEIPTFIMLRRMALLAWIGSHGETDLARQVGAPYTYGSCALAEEYLRRFG
jgi:Ser/Thr protein kinase RdoA (MazF antagonist)